MYIDTMRKIYLPDVVEIEKNDDALWSKKDFIDFFMGQSKGLGFVLIDNLRIVGFICFKILKKQICVIKISAENTYYMENIYDILYKKVYFEKYYTDVDFSCFEKIFCCNETKINKLKFLSNQGLKSKLISNKKHKDDLIVFFEKKCNFSSADVEW